MSTQEKKDQIKSLAIEMLNASYDAMLKKIDIAINSDAIDIDVWEKDNSPMVLPKTVIASVLESESVQYYGRGTSTEKQIKKGIKNLRYFI